MERHRPIAIELRHLRYFLAVIDELHFGRAAERVHISQPPLSQAIRKMESELGVRLLERTSRHVTPTEAGTAFAEEARKVLAGFDVAVAEAHRAGGVSSTLRIGCTPNLPMEQLRRFLGALKERDPKLHPEVTHQFALEQIARLRRGELDVGIFSYAEDPYDIELEKLFPGNLWTLLLPTGHPLAERDALGPDDLRSEQLVTFTRAVNPALHASFLRSLEAEGYSFDAVREAGGGTARDLVMAVAAGNGVAFVPTPFTDGFEAAEIVVDRPLDPPVRMPDTMVAWREAPPRHLNYVIGTIREVARALRERQEAAPLDRTAGRIGRTHSSTT
jgi:DNA-binding transcriptional LysR family regulator